MSVDIVEIIGRSEQGVTRPFICRGDDGWLYYVKGGGAGRRALIAEWMAGHLGKRLGLPIPDFRQAIIAKDLVALSARDDIADLGSAHFCVQPRRLERCLPRIHHPDHECCFERPRRMVAGHAARVD